MSLINIEKRCVCNETKQPMIQHYFSAFSTWKKLDLGSCVEMQLFSEVKNQRYKPQTHITAWLKYSLYK